MAQNYQVEKFPFAPSITTELKNNTDGTVDLTFKVDETAPITQIQVQGNSLISNDVIVQAFQPLFDAKKFTPDVYYQAVQKIQDAYAQAGYLQAGVDIQASTLKDGVLKAQIIEGKISLINFTDIDDPKVTLQAKVGDPVSAAKIKADIRTLSNKLGKSIGFALAPDPENPAKVTLVFGNANVTSGPINSINFAGNTLISNEELRSLLSIRVSDTYTPQLAQEDFLKIRDLYRKKGYEISTREAITFKDNALTYNIREIKLTGYELQWQGEHITQDRVILRMLPAEGHLFNRNALNTAVGNVGCLGFVRPVSENFKTDPKNPENLIYVLGLADDSSKSFLSSLKLGVGYDSLSGFSGGIDLINPNMFGLAHTANLSFNAQQNDAGQNLVGGIGYSIPWLDTDFLDFRTTPTSLSFDLGTSVTPNYALRTKTTSTPSDTDTGWDYTTRNTGFKVSAGRVLAPNLSASLGFGITYNTYFLEALTSSDVTTTTVNGVSYTFKEADVTSFLPESSLTTRIGLGLNYDSTDSSTFPITGVRASAKAGYNFGRQGSTPLSWGDFETGASTYIGFGEDVPQAIGTPLKTQVFAVRANVGTVISPSTAAGGTSYTVGGGSTPDYSKQIRGIGNGELTGTSYFTSSAEYRYDLGLKNSFVQGIYAVGFLDAGSAWGTTDNPNFNLKYGLGAGVQANLGIVNLRLDYGYSPQTGSGQVYFRIGNFW